MATTPTGYYQQQAPPGMNVPQVMTPYYGSSPLDPSTSGPQINYPGGTPNFNEQTGSYNTPAPPPTQQPSGPSWPGIDTSGINPQLVGLFQQYGVTPTGRGTGYTDIGYWNDKISAPGADSGYYLGRLQYELTHGGQDQYASSAAAGVSPSTASAAAPYTFGTGVPGMGTIFGAGGVAGSAAGNDLFNYLMQRGQGITSDANLPALQLSANDPIIKAQTDAYRAEQDRAARSYESQAAEKAGSSGNIDAVTRSMTEQAAQNTSGFEAQLLSSELNARRQEIEQALSGTQGMLTAEQALQLQEELSQLQLAQQAYQFDTGNAINVGLA